MGWDNITEMVEMVHIYPHRQGNHTTDFKEYLKEQVLNVEKANKYKNQLDY